MAAHNQCTKTTTLKSAPRSNPASLIVEAKRAIACLCVARCRDPRPSFFRGETKRAVTQLCVSRGRVLRPVVAIILAHDVFTGCPSSGTHCTRRASVNTGLYMYVSLCVSVSVSLSLAHASHGRHELTHGINSLHP